MTSGGASPLTNSTSFSISFLWWPSVPRKSDRIGGQSRVRRLVQFAVRQEAVVVNLIVIIAFGVVEIHERRLVTVVVRHVETDELIAVKTLIDARIYAAR